MATAQADGGCDRPGRLQGRGIRTRIRRQRSGSAREQAVLLDKGKGFASPIHDSRPPAMVGTAVLGGSVFSKSVMQHRVMVISSKYYQRA